MDPLNRYKVEFTFDVRSQAEAEDLTEIMRMTANSYVGKGKVTHSVIRQTQGHFVHFPQEGCYDVVLEDSGDHMIQCIKAVRACLNLGLREAKTLVDQARGDGNSTLLVENVNGNDAHTIETEIEAAGGSVSITRSTVSDEEVQTTILKSRTLIRELK